MFDLIQKEAYLAQLLWAHRDDLMMFEQWTHDLPRYPEAWAPGADAHSIASFRLCLKVAKPTCLLEIGFNIGGSAALWLNLGVSRVVSVDINQAPIVREAGEILKGRFRDRFKLVITDEKQRDETVRAFTEPFDVAFIDAAHDHENVMADIKLVLSLGIKRLIFDDICPHWGPGVWTAISESGLKLMAIIGNLAYCEPVDGKKTYVRTI